MKKLFKLRTFSVFYCVLTLGAPGANVYANDSVITEFLQMDTLADHEVAHLLITKCRRHGVVWSGGMALRFSDRISPRPIRSRWERDRDSRIRCRGIDAFERRRVSDEPWIR